MSELIKAARRQDLLVHDMSQYLRLLAGAGWLWKGSKYVKAVLLFASFTPGGAALFLATIAIEYVVGELIDCAADTVGKNLKGSPVPEIKTGSDNVGINGRPAARGGSHDDACHGDVIKFASKWVSINKKPAARVGDTLKWHSASIATGSDDVFIGGPEAEKGDTENPLQHIMKEIFSVKDVAKGFKEHGIKGGVTDIVKDGLSKGLDAAGADKPIEALWKKVFD